MQPTNLTLPADLKRRAKAKAAREGMSLSEVVRWLLAGWLSGTVERLDCPRGGMKVKR